MGNVIHILEGFNNLLKDKFLILEEDIVELSNKRMDVCKECKPYFIKMTSRCGKCGCYLPAKTKVTSEQCPIKRWKKI